MGARPAAFDARTLVVPALAVAAAIAAPAGGRADEAIVVATGAPSRLRALDCVSGRETGAFAPPTARVASVALAPDGRAAFVATVDRRLLRLSLPALEPDASAPLAFTATALAASGGDDAMVLAAGAGRAPLSAHDASTLGTQHEYPLENDRAATVSSVVDRPQRSRFVVAFSDLDEVWEIDYRHDAEPVLKGLVHDYRMREAVELPGRFTPRPFKVPGATRALVAGAVPHEVLRIDDAGALGVLNLDVRREIERPAAATVPAAQRIVAWRGTRARGWVLADEGASGVRVLDAGDWKFAEPIPLGGEVLAIAALEDGGVLAAVAAEAGISIARLDVEQRRTRPVMSVPSEGNAPWRFVAGTRGCLALVDADGRWTAGITRGMRAAAPGRGS